MYCQRIRTGVGIICTLAITSLAGADALSRDVVIVGGGASGAHAAVWLRDHGKSVVVVEKQDTLGGHTAVYHDPTTGKPINIGVQTWVEYLNSTSFPERMGVLTNGSMQFGPSINKYIDFKTGLPVPDYIPAAYTDTNIAMQKYLELCEKYANMLTPGFFDFPAPDKIPEDLLMPFGQFVEKYNLTAVVPQLWDVTVMGVGDLMDIATMYIMQAFGVPMAQALLGIARAIVPPSGNLHELYERIEEFLGEDVLYESMVSSSKRTDTGVSVSVRSAEGTVTEIVAKRLLIAIEPTLENMAPFNLDSYEKDVLSKLEYTTVYAGLVKHPSLETGTSYTNTVPAAAGANYSAFPLPSQVGKINPQVGSTDLFAFTAVGTDKDTTESMQALIKKSVDNMITAGTIPATDGTVAFAAFGDHGHMHSRVSADELRKGFIQRQLALQGRNSTWYTGAAFSAGYSTVLWAYNDILLPKVIEGL